MRWANPLRVLGRPLLLGCNALRARWLEWPKVSRIVLLLLFALAYAPHLWQVTYMLNRGFYFGEVLAQIVVAFLVVLLLLLILPVRVWLLVEGLVLLLFPLELTSWLTLREPLSYSVYCAVRRTTFHEASSQLMAFLIPAVLFVGLMVVYFVLTFRHAPRGFALRWRQRLVGLAIFAVLFVATPILAVRPVVNGDGLLYWAYHYREAYRHLSMATFPLDVVSHTMRYQEEMRAAEAVFAMRGQPPMEDLQKPTDTVPTLGVLVIGETSRACNWSLAGYARDTNPRLSKRSDLHFFTDVYSGANNTINAVPMLLSTATPEAKDRWMHEPFVTEVLAAAGYRVTWVTLQGEGEVWLSALLKSCDSKHIVTSTVFDASPMDGTLIRYVDEFLSENEGRSALLVLHTMGGHFQYTDRYPAQEAYFQPEMSRDYKRWLRMLNSGMREELVNSFDNTVRYTDKVLDSVIRRLESADRSAFMLYVADHGENLYDAPGVGVLHASAKPSHYEAHVPYLVWLSPEYRRRHPERDATLSAHRASRVQSTCTFHTLLGLAGVRYAGYDARQSLVDTAFRPVTMRPVLGNGGEVVTEPPYPTDGTCACGAR